MWPLFLDMTRDECKKTLRRLELEAYGSIVSALRAQGGFSSDKHKLLQDIASILNIPQERHRAEIRRAVNDEKLATVAHCMTGDDTSDEWALEGRRLIPLMPRLVPQTAFSVIADEEANRVSIDNDKLPLPAQTERKRPLQTTVAESTNKSIHFRVPSESSQKSSIQSAVDELNNKKRKPNLNMESSSLAQHLMMGQPKISRVQQLYRQKSKALLKSQMKHRAPPSTIHSTPSNVPKLNTIKQEDEIKTALAEVPIPLPKPTIVDSKVGIPVNVASPPISNENQTPKVKPTVIHTTTVKPITVPSTNNIITTDTQQKSIKICPARKVITTTARTPTQPQKVIIVSTSQGTTTSSILQRTLTIPFVKTISMKSLDKVKVINNTVNIQTTSGTTTLPNSINPKPKLLTLQTKLKTGTPAKHLNIPFIQGVQLQALQNKGAIKMLPLSSSAKVTSKSGSVYIMNSNTSIAAVTTSNTSPVVSTKTQSAIPDDIKPIISSEDSQQQEKIENKSSVLAEILKASGVLPTDDVEQNNDIESQISQLTQIPNQTEEFNVATITTATQNDNVDLETVLQEGCPETIERFEQDVLTDLPDTSNFVILHENEESQEETLLLDEHQTVNEEVVELMGSLDPETGMYSMKPPPPPQEYELLTEEPTSSHCHITSDSSYIVEIESLEPSDLDMPSLSN